jgi:hypothetical protein
VLGLRSRPACAARGERPPRDLPFDVRIVDAGSELPRRGGRRKEKRRRGGGEEERRRGGEKETRRGGEKGEEKKRGRERRREEEEARGRAIEIERGPDPEDNASPLECALFALETIAQRDPLRRVCEPADYRGHLIIQSVRAACSTISRVIDTESVGCHPRSTTKENEERKKRTKKKRQQHKEAAEKPLKSLGRFDTSCRWPGEAETRLDGCVTGIAIDPVFPGGGFDSFLCGF